MRTPKEIAQEAREALDRNSETPPPPPPGMSCWYPSTQELPDLEVGDRVLIVVRELPYREARYCVDQVVILIATETGWDSPDPIYQGYGPGDGDFWMLEKDLLSSISR